MNQEDLDALLASEGVESEQPESQKSQSESDDDMDSLQNEILEQAAAEEIIEPDSVAGGGNRGMSGEDLSEWGLNESDMEKAPSGGANKAANVSFNNLASNKSPGQVHDLDFILDIPLRLTVEVGRTNLEIGELLHLGPGSIVELDKLAGEPLDVFANNKLVARGEAVVINEKFGIRLTDVVSQHERIEKLH